MISPPPARTKLDTASASAAERWPSLAARSTRWRPRPPSASWWRATSRSKAREASSALSRGCARAPYACSAPSASRARTEVLSPRPITQSYAFERGGQGAPGGLPAELGGSSLALLDQFLAQAGVSQQPLQAGGDRVHVLGLHLQRRPRRQLGQRPLVPDQGGQAPAQGVEERDAEALVEAGIGERGRMRVEGGQGGVVHVSEQADASLLGQAVPVPARAAGDHQRGRV